MSNVKIKANASGTADFTIQAPATDSALTLTLPSVDGELLTTNGDASGLQNVESAFNTQIGGRRNLIINGAMQVAQRGTTYGPSNSASYTTVDRFRTTRAGGSGNPALNFSQETDAPSGSGFSYSHKVSCNAAVTYQTYFMQPIEHNIEGQNLQHLMYGTSDAKSLTLSFWIKSSETGGLAVAFQTQDSSSNTHNYSDSITISSADTWEYKTITVTGNTANNIKNSSDWGMRIRWHLHAGTDFTSGTAETWAAYANANTAVGQTINIATTTGAYVAITGVQLEVGSVATPFEHRSYGEELALCQRYYVEWKDDGDQQGSFNTTCTANDTVSGYKDLPVWMRIPPTVTSTSLQHSVGGLTNGLRSVNSTGSEIDQIFVRVTWSHTEANSHTGILYTLDGGYVRADAEL